MSKKISPVTKDGFLREWLAIGSFSDKAENLHAANAFRPDAIHPFTGKKDAGTKWLQMNSSTPSIDLISLMTEWEFYDYCYCYAHLYVHSKENTSAILSSGSDDGVVVWFNGQQVYSHDEQRGVQVDQDKIPVELKKGWNRLMLKVTQYIGAWGFVMRFLSHKNAPIEGLKYSLDDPIKGKWQQEDGSKFPFYMMITPPDVSTFRKSDPDKVLSCTIWLQNFGKNKTGSGEVVITDWKQKQMTSVKFPALKPLEHVSLETNLSLQDSGRSWLEPFIYTAQIKGKIVSLTLKLSVDMISALIAAVKNPELPLKKDEKQDINLIIDEVTDAPDILLMNGEINHCVNNLTTLLLDGGKKDLILNEVDACNKFLDAEHALIADRQIYMVGHGHIDMNWLWRWPETVQICRDTFRQVLRFMDEFPDFHYSQSQAACYKAMELYEPGIFEGIKKQVSAGRWNIVGGAWTEGDTNIPSGEAIARSFLLAQTFFQKHFGTRAKVGWLPDNFGHTAQLPQILNLAGIDSFYHMRTGPKGAQLYWWESPDGSRVLAKTGQGYGDPVTPMLRKFPEALLPDIKKQMFVYGVGDHGGGPARRDIEAAKKYQKRKLFPEIKFSSANKYFEEVQSRTSGLPVHRGELQFIFEGCYTNISNIKKGNRSLENALQTAEACAFAAIQSGLQWPEKELNKAWEILAFNQFHDILPGSAIHESNDDSRARYAHGVSIAELIKTRSLAVLASRINIIQKDFVPVMVFNPLAWTRSDIVMGELIVSDPFSSISVFDSEGDEVAAQIIRTKQFDAYTHLWIQFHADNVPGIGYKVYKVKFAPAGEKPFPIRSWTFPYPEFSRLPEGTSDVRSKYKITRKGMKIKNRFFEIEINEKSGVLDSCKLIKNNRLQANIIGKQGANFLGIYMEAAHGMSAWSLDKTAQGPISPELVKPMEFLQEGPESISWCAEYKHDRSRFWLTTTVHADSPRIDCHLRADWLEKGDEHHDAPMLRVHFSIAGKPDKLICDVPFAVVERPVDQEVPAQKWVDVQANVEQGLALLNRSKYGHSLVKNTLRLTLLRSSYDPDILPDVGRHEIDWALLPHEGTWQKNNLPRAGCSYNVPLEIYQARVQTGDMGNTHSFLSIDKSDEHVVVTGIKQALAGVLPQQGNALPHDVKNSIIVRGYNPTDKNGKMVVEVEGGVREAVQTNLLEEPLKDGKAVINENRAEVDIKAFGIVTVKIN